MTEKSPTKKYSEEDIEIIELGDSTSLFIKDFVSDIPEIEKFVKNHRLKSVAWKGS